MPTGRRDARFGPLAILFLFATSACVSARPLESEPPQVDAEIFVFGDAGDFTAAPVLAALTRTINASPAAKDRIRLLVVGDNIYEEGLPDSSDLVLRQQKERIFDQQIAVFRDTRVTGWFVPGNHDWANMGPDGLNAILRQQRYLAAHAGGRTALYPGNGCPGPAVIEVGRTVRVLLLDTEWWLRIPGYEMPAGCAAGTRVAVVDSMRRVLARRGRYALVAAHHPIATGGEHGGYFLRPRPPDIEDLGSAPYTVLRDDLAVAFAEHPPLVYATGHDHSLQVLNGTGGTTLLVSGAGSEATRVRMLPETVLADSAMGFMRLTFHTDRSVYLTVYALAPDGSLQEAFARWLVPSRRSAQLRGAAGGGVTGWSAAR